MYMRKINVVLVPIFIIHNNHIKISPKGIVMNYTHRSTQTLDKRNCRPLEILLLPEFPPDGVYINSSVRNMKISITDMSLVIMRKLRYKKKQ